MLPCSGPEEAKERLQEPLMPPLQPGKEGWAEAPGIAAQEVIPWRSRRCPSRHCGQNDLVGMVK